jgi:hypothetical protein
VLLGLSLPYAIVGSISAIQLFTPNELMGRVSGVDNLIVGGLQTIGIGAGAALIGAVFYRDLCYFVAITMGVSALYIFTRQGPAQVQPAAAARRPRPRAVAPTEAQPQLA